MSFYFDHKLSFQEHVRYYTTKALTTIRALGMLGNSSRGVSVVHKHLLYRACVVSVATYGLQLWYLQGSHHVGLAKHFSMVQCIAALWIMGCFCTSLTGGAEALAGLLPMHLLLKRLAERSCAHTATLGHSHPVHMVLGGTWTGLNPPLALSVESLSLAVH